MSTPRRWGMRLGLVVLLGGACLLWAVTCAHHRTTAAPADDRHAAPPATRPARPDLALTSLQPAAHGQQPATEERLLAALRAAPNPGSRAAASPMNDRGW